MATIDLQWDVDFSEPDQDGWALNHILKDVWDDLGTVIGMEKEPVTGAIIREAEYDYIDTNHTDWTAQGTGDDRGSWMTIYGGWGESCNWMYQADAGIPDGGTYDWPSGTLVSDDSYPARRGMYHCLHWWRWPTGIGTAEDVSNYTTEIAWGTHAGDTEPYRLALKIDDKGELSLYDREDGTIYGTAQMSAQPFDRQLWIRVLPTRENEYVIATSDGEGFVTNPRLPSLDGSPIEIRYNGSLLYSLKPITFGTSGTLESQEYDPGFAHDGGTFAVDTLEGTGGTTTIEDIADGTAIQYQIVATGGTDETQLVFSAQCDIEATGTLGTGGSNTYYPRSMSITRQEGQPSDGDIRLYEIGAGTALWGETDVPVQIRRDGTVIATGLASTPEKSSELETEMVIHYEDLWKRLDDALLMDGEAYDGQDHGVAIGKLLARAGMANSASGTFVYVFSSDGQTLPEKDEDEGYMFQPELGQTVGDMVRHICDKFSGWHFGFNRQGTAEYVPPDSIGTCETLVATTALENQANGTYAAQGELREEWNDDDFLNDIWVVGWDEVNGTGLHVHWRDHESLDDSSSEKYSRGRLKPLIYVDGGLNEERELNIVLRRLQAEYNRIRHILTWRQDIDPELDIGGTVDYGGTGYQVLSVTDSLDENLHDYCDVSAERI